MARVQTGARVAGAAAAAAVALGLGGFLGARASRAYFDPPTEVRPGLWQTRNQTVFLYAARAGDHVLLVDAGADPLGRPIDALLTVLRARREDVSAVLVTHGHSDHRAGAALFPRAELLAGAGDVDLVAGRAAPEDLGRRILRAALPVPPAAVTRPLLGEADVALAPSLTVHAVPMPGHTPGSYAFWIDGALFVGDAADLDGGRLAPPPAWIDRHPEATRRSVVGLLAALQGRLIDVVCTGHGGCTGPGQGRRLLEEYVARLAP